MTHQGLVLLREFIIGSNPLGTVVTSGSGNVTVIGGEDPSLLIGPNNILPEWTVPVVYGSGTATSNYVAPSSIVEAWSEFFAAAVTSVATVAPNASPTVSPSLTETLVATVTAIATGTAKGV